MEKVFFLGKRTSPTRIFDDKGLIGTFENVGGSVVRQGDGTLVRADDQVWLMTLEDPELIERARKHPAYNKRFKEVNGVPQKAARANILTGAMGNVSQIKAEAEAEKKYEAKLERVRRYYQLQAQLFKKDGKPIANADEALLQEYEALKAELEG